MPIKKFKDPFLPSKPVGRTAAQGGRQAPSPLKAETRPKAEAPVTSISPLAPSKTFNRETLKDSWNKLSGRTMAYLLEENRLERLLEESKLKDIAIVAGISTEKVLLMEGQPTQIIAQAQQIKLDQLGIVLKDALEKRGIVTLTERKAEISLDGPGTPSKA